MAGSSTDRFRSVLKHRDFRLLVVSFLIDQIGSWSYSVVILVVIFQRTGSTFAIAALAATRWITGLLVSGYAGVIADRVERTRVMIVSALASAVVMIGIAVVVGLDGPIWLLIGLSIATAVTTAPYRPASGALTPEIVRESELAAANGVYTTLESITIVLGPAFGGLLLLLGAHVLGVAINAASFLVAAVLVSRLKVRSTGSAEPGGRMLAQWIDGVRALRAAHVAFVLVIFCALDSAVYGAATVIYAPLSIHLGTGAGGYSYLLAGAALGGVIAAGIANKLSESTRLAPIIVASITLQAIPFPLTILTHDPAVAFALQAVSGIGMIIVDVLAITALQRDLDRGVLSRVLGVFDAAVLAATAAASFLTAAVFAAAGLDATLIAIGVFFPVAALIGLPMLLRSDRETAARVRELAPIVDLLAELDLFTSASRTTLEGLAADAQREVVEAGAVIIRQGDPAETLYILAEGTLAVHVTDERGVSRELPPVTAPGYVGELGLIHQVPRTATVTAVSDAVIQRIDGARFIAAMETATASRAFTDLSGVRWSRTAPLRSAAERSEPSPPADRDLAGR
ncbi:MAG TPA: MFS transporter [Mycobacteriales bacterium]|nr:MFS transporter [Mycobacteriales bacterium]